MTKRLGFTLLIYTDLGEGEGEAWAIQNAIDLLDEQGYHAEVYTAMMPLGAEGQES